MKPFVRRRHPVPRVVQLSSEDLPDPNVLPVPGGYYVYSTNRRDLNVPVPFSPDLEHFTAGPGPA